MVETELKELLDKIRNRKCEEQGCGSEGST